MVRDKVGLEYMAGTCTLLDLIHNSVRSIRTHKVTFGVPQECRGTWRIVGTSRLWSEDGLSLFWMELSLWCLIGISLGTNQPLYLALASFLTLWAISVFSWTVHLSWITSVLSNLLPAVPNLWKTYPCFSDFHIRLLHFPSLWSPIRPPS